MSAAVLLALLVAADPLPEPIDPMDTEALEALTDVLRGRVALLRSTMPEPSASAFAEPMVVEGWAIVTGSNELRCQGFLVKEAKQTTVVGPSGELPARVTRLDVERRVAWLKTEQPVGTIGLEVSPRSDPKERKEGDVLLALVSTAPGAGVLSGELTDLGKATHLEGNLRSSFSLAAGMPVFDLHLRWVGLARVVAWDKDRSMLIPPELTDLSSAAAVVKPSEAPKKAERPWWAK